MNGRSRVEMSLLVALLTVLATHLTVIGCGGALPVRAAQGAVATSGGVNLARMTGTRLYVPNATEKFPPLALVDGVSVVDEWVPGAGWQLEFDGPLLRNRYFDPTFQARSDEPIEWAGLRRNFRNGKEYSALGWVILESDRSHVIDAVTVHSVDTAGHRAHLSAVRDLLIEYWDAPTDRWVAVVTRDTPRHRRHTVKGNLLPRLNVEFYPARTDLLRIAVQWTNDSRVVRSFTVMGRREEYVTGTIRLTEVEVFGIPEEGDVLAETARLRLPTQEPVSQGEAAFETAWDPDREEAAVLATVAAYGTAYADRDLEVLMTTISEDYLHDGENASEFLSRHDETFRDFPYYLFRLSDGQVDVMDGSSATVTALFWLRLMPLIPQATEGKIRFTLTRADDGWRIRGLDTSPS